MSELLTFLRSYGLAIFHYWWLMIFGAPQVINNVWKWFHPQRKDAPIPHWVRVTFGVFAIVLAQGLVYRDSLKNLNTVIQEKQDAVSENWRLKHSGNASTPAPKSKSLFSGSTTSAVQSRITGQSVSASPSGPPQSVPAAQSTPQTQAERLMQINKNLPKGDRDRLADVLYDFSKTLDQMTDLGYKANLELAQVNNGVRSGSIVNDYEDHRKQLRGIATPAKEMARSFLISREQKWRYYQDQMRYVFGDNPDNEGPNAIINATEGYANALDQWSSIQDRGSKGALTLLSTAQIESDRYLHTFFSWRQGCETRLAQMKQSIQ
jgi:hypothetical protein